LKVGDKFFIRLAYPAEDPVCPKMPPGVLLSGLSSLEAGDFEMSLFVDEVTLPGGLVVFFTLEYCLFIGVPEAVLAAMRRLIRLPVPVLVGGVSTAICCYLAY